MKRLLFLSVLALGLAPATFAGEDTKCQSKAVRVAKSMFVKTLKAQGVKVKKKDVVVDYAYQLDNDESGVVYDVGFKDSEGQRIQDEYDRGVAKVSLDSKCRVLEQYLSIANG